MYLTTKTEAIELTLEDISGVEVENVSTFDEVTQRKKVMQKLKDADGPNFKAHLAACVAIFPGGQFGGEKKTTGMSAKIKGDTFDYGEILGLKSGKGNKNLKGDDLTPSRVAAVLLPEAFNLAQSKIFKNSAVRRKINGLWLDEESAMYAFVEGYKIGEKVTTGWGEQMKAKVFGANIVWALYTAEKAESNELLLSVGRTISQSAVRQNINPELLDAAMTNYANGGSSASSKGVMKYFAARVQLQRNPLRTYAGRQGVIVEVDEGEKEFELPTKQFGRRKGF